MARLLGPAVADAARRCDDHDPDPTDDLWRRVATEGTPLLDPVPGEPGRRVVTFLWRGPGPVEPTDGVLLLANRLTDRHALADSLLEHLAGTDVWHLAIEMRDDWQATYQFGVALPGARRETPPGPLRGTAAGPGGAAAPPGHPDHIRFAPLLANVVTDPTNPASMPSKWPGAPFSVVALPAVAPSPEWSTDAPAVVTCDEVASAHLGGARTVWTTATRAADHEPANLVVLLDGELWSGDYGAPSAIAALDGEGELGPLVVAMVDAIDQPTRSRDCSCSDAFADFLAEELVPWLRARHDIAPGAEHVTVAGQSLGGLAAAHAALRHPDVLGRVSSQSGSFWWRGGSAFDVEAEQLTRRYARADHLPVSVDLWVGLQENLLLAPTRHLRDVLEARRVPVRHHEVNGGHDALWWRSALSATLRRSRGDGEGRSAGRSDGGTGAGPAAAPSPTPAA
jgi:enterochelin esterase-like enzyme